MYKFFLKKYYFNKALKEKDNFIKSNKIKRIDNLFINKVYHYYIKKY